jgi:hypothetical protein
MLAPLKADYGKMAGIGFDLWAGAGVDGPGKQHL